MIDQRTKEAVVQLPLQAQLLLFVASALSPPITRKGLLDAYAGVRKKLNGRLERMDDQALNDHLQRLQNDGLVKGASNDASGGSRKGKARRTSPGGSLAATLGPGEVKNFLKSKPVCKLLLEIESSI